jgi:hypothetical protein
MLSSSGQWTNDTFFVQISDAMHGRALDELAMLRL